MTLSLLLYKSMDYTNLGLNSNLQPVNSPITNNNETRTTAYKFSSQFERNTITSMNIRDFNFSTGRGGTLALGGTVNGDGFLSVDNNSGTEIVRIDNNGIAVNEGSISIKDSNGTTIIDSLGLVNANIFSHTGQRAGPNQSFTTNSFVDVPNSTATLTLQRGCFVLFLLQCDAYLVESAGNTGNGQIQLWVNSDGQASPVINFNAGQDQLQTRVAFFVIYLSSGVNTIKVRGRLSTIFNGSPYVVLNNYIWEAILIGQ